jgi:Ca-activated chloride channel homolog
LCLNLWQLLQQLDESMQTGKSHLKKTILLLLLFASVFAGNLTAQEQPARMAAPISRILFIFDASKSMLGYWDSDSKINIARDYLIRIIDSLQYLENVEMALRVFGHQSPIPPQDCSDSKLEVPFAKNNASRIRQKLRFIEPRGTTPMANSIELAGNDFPACSGCRNIIILITDGIEECNGDPCKASYDIQKKGIALKPFIIGIGVDEGFKETFKCIGSYFSANRETQLKEFLNIVITQALNSTTAQVNLLDQDGNPTETNVDMTFYDRFSGKVRNNYMHTINNKGNPDTLILDPLVTYDITVHTIPPIHIDSVKVVPGKHTIIAGSAPQGFLVLKASGGIDFRDMDVFVRKSGEKETLNNQKMYQSVKYIVGKYDIELPTLPRLLIKNVDIKQSNTTTIEIPRPGIANFLMNNMGIGSILQQEGDSLTRIYELSSQTTSESVRILPGKYRAVFRPLNSKQSIYTISSEFEIKSGSAITIRLY